jgi:hypothetical protein
MLSKRLSLGRSNLPRPKGASTSLNGSLSKSSGDVGDDWISPAELAEAIGAYSLDDEGATDLDRAAVDLALTALSYLARDDSWGYEGCTDEAGVAIARAHAALVRGASAARHRWVNREIEGALRVGSAMGWAKAARSLVRALRLPASLVPELEKRLAGHVVAPKQGRLPTGKHTTATIAEWITGDRQVKKYASKVEK